MSSRAAPRASPRTRARASAAEHARGVAGKVLQVWRAGPHVQGLLATSPAAPCQSLAGPCKRRCGSQRGCRGLGQACAPLLKAS